jgi:hypothetical protein
VVVAQLELRLEVALLRGAAVHVCGARGDLLRRQAQQRRVRLVRHVLVE